MKNKQLKALLIMLTLIFSMIQIAAPAQAMVDGKKNPVCISPKMVQLKTDMQKVWIDHTIWTRSYIVSAISNRRISRTYWTGSVRNQQDIGNVGKTPTRRS
ncbi:hypothetical protein [Paenibacillus sp. AR247]|uniref:hypothetical protein n=1 Tax=Paenibacillus sp. AR247 TaxID=1631599 RepID=UPI000CF99BBD|nr:hypothetical protein [Paenibacillus sp. AR247]PQP88339.1 hypothetical protein CPT76_08100 [Paenibacillus sp. AR247]